MIARLVGKIIDKQVTTVILDVHGVGYELDVPMSTLFALPDNGAEATLFTHLAVREDAQKLFGFINRNDRDLFRNLIKVNGIGARTALAMLSAMDADTLVHCIITDDTVMLAKVPGIGKKTAERVIIDMRDKLKNWGLDNAMDRSTVASNNTLGSIANQIENDAIAGLVSLGYKSAEANKAVKSVTRPDMSSEELIRLSLQSMVSK